MDQVKMFYTSSIITLVKSMIGSQWPSAKMIFAVFLLHVVLAKPYYSIQSAVFAFHGKWINTKLQNLVALTCD